MVSTSSAAQLLQAVAKPIISGLTVIVPLLIVTVSKIYHRFRQLPQNALLFLYGCVLCFFGGTFPVLFAAIQAAKHGGRKAVIEAVADLANEAMTIIEESKKDDAKDDDADGKKDVEQLTSTQLLTRKTQLVLKKMNPEKLDKAISSIYKVWLSVAAVLSIQFARVISMALTIAEFLQQPCDRFLAPTLKLAIPKDYQKWVPVVLSWIVKAIAMSLAFYIQSVMSAAASAMHGGLMMARAFYDFCLCHKITLFGLLPADHKETYIDEVFSYVFAAAGFFVQFESNFSIAFPLNLVLWPFQFLEYYLRWSITKR